MLLLVSRDSGAASHGHRSVLLQALADDLAEEGHPSALPALIDIAFELTAPYADLRQASSKFLAWLMHLTWLGPQTSGHFTPEPLLAVNRPEPGFQVDLRSHMLYACPHIDFNVFPEQRSGNDAA